MVPNHQSFRPNPQQKPVFCTVSSRVTRFWDEMSIFLGGETVSGKVCRNPCNSGGSFAMIHGFCNGYFHKDSTGWYKAWTSHEKLWTDGYVHGNLMAPPNATLTPSPRKQGVISWSRGLALRRIHLDSHDMFQMMEVFVERCWKDMSIPSIYGILPIFTIRSNQM